MKYIGLVFEDGFAWYGNLTKQEEENIDAIIENHQTDGYSEPFDWENADTTKAKIRRSIAERFVVTDDYYDMFSTPLSEAIDYIHYIEKQLENGDVSEIIEHLRDELEAEGFQDWYYDNCRKLIKEVRKYEKK